MGTYGGWLRNPKKTVENGGKHPMIFFGLKNHPVGLSDFAGPSTDFRRGFSWDKIFGSKAQDE